MLDYFFKNELVHITKKHPENWEEAIWISGEVLKDKGIIANHYIQRVIADVKEYGPYIVIIPEVAIPHSTADKKGVFGTAISLTIFPKSIVFEEGNPEKNAKLFFMLAAKNQEEHMENISQLSEMLMLEGVVNDLVNVKRIEDYIKVMEKYEV